MGVCYAARFASQVRHRQSRYGIALLASLQKSETVPGTGKFEGSSSPSAASAAAVHRKARTNRTTFHSFEMH